MSNIPPPTTLPNRLPLSQEGKRERRARVRINNGSKNEGSEFRLLRPACCKIQNLSLRGSFANLPTQHVWRPFPSSATASEQNITMSERTQDRNTYTKIKNTKNRNRKTASVSTEAATSNAHAATGTWHLFCVCDDYVRASSRTASEEKQSEN